MVRLTYVTACLAAIACLSQPCAAQTANSALYVQQPAAFVGLNMQVPLGARTKTKPSLRLQVRSDFRGRDYAKLDTLAPRPKGLEIGLLKTGKPAVFFNGERAMDAQTRLGLGASGGNTFLIVGGVLLAVVVVAVAAGGAGLGDTCPTIDGSRDHCINP